MGRDPDRFDPEDLRDGALMRASLLLLIAVIGSACQSVERHAFYEKRDLARSARVNDRQYTAGSLVWNCCDPSAIDPSGRSGLKATQVAACGEVGRLLALEDENEVLERLIYGPLATCYRQFPTSTIARLCRSGPCSRSLRSNLVAVLRKIPPSPEITRTLLAQVVDSDERTQTSISLALGRMGEPDLGPAIEALSSPDPVVRRTVVKGFHYAVWWRSSGAPLDLPALVPALVRAAIDPDPAVAVSACVALKDYFSWQVSPEDMVGRLERNYDPDTAIRYLAVRQFSCRTEAAVAALQRMADGPDKVADAARAALAFRKERCARL